MTRIERRTRRRFLRFWGRHYYLPKCGYRWSSLTTLRRLDLKLRPEFGLIERVRFIETNG